jgi:AcrR family transcriptional regulator
MAGNFKREDLRTLKTRTACIGALQALLERVSFPKLTVYGICDEALVSRAAFYAHFADKYDLLKHWLASQRAAMTGLAGPPRKSDPVRIFADFLETRRVCLCNVLKEADGETRDLLSAFLYETMDALSRQSRGVPGSRPRRRAALVSFCSGGLLRFLVTYAKDNFTPEDTTAVPYLFGLLEAVFAWDSTWKEV